MGVCNINAVAKILSLRGLSLHLLDTCFSPETFCDIKGGIALVTKAIVALDIAMRQFTLRTSLINIYM